MERSGAVPLRDPLTVPGADHTWLRNALTSPVSLDRPPLTVQAVQEVRRRIVIQLEHGVISVRSGRSLLRRLDRQEAWIRASEIGWTGPKSRPPSP